LATFSAATAAAAASALLAVRAFALMACGGIDTTTNGAVAGLSSAEASSSRGGFGFDGLLLEVRDLLGGYVARVEVEVSERGVIAFEAGLFGFILFVSAHGADGCVDEDHGGGNLVLYD